MPSMRPHRGYPDAVVRSVSRLVGRLRRRSRRGASCGRGTGSRALAQGGPVSRRSSAPGASGSGCGAAPQPAVRHPRHAGPAALVAPAKARVQPGRGDWTDRGQGAAGSFLPALVAARATGDPGGLSDARRPGAGTAWSVSCRDPGARDCRAFGRRRHGDGSDARRVCACVATTWRTRGLGGYGDAGARAPVTPSARSAVHTAVLASDKTKKTSSDVARIEMFRSIPNTDVRFR